VSVFEGNEASATNACDGVLAGYAALGEELTEAVGTVGLLVAGGEALAGERSVAVSAREALTVPGLVLVGHAARRNDLVALDAAGGELLLVAASAVDFLLSRDEGLGANGCLADAALETLLVPLSRLVLHLFVTCPEDLGAAITAGGKLGVVAGAAVDLLHLAAELLVHRRD